CRKALYCNNSEAFEIRCTDEDRALTHQSAYIGLGWTSNKPHAVRNALMPCKGGECCQVDIPWSAGDLQPPFGIKMMQHGNELHHEVEPLVCGKATNARDCLCHLRGSCTSILCDINAVFYANHSASAQPGKPVVVGRRYGDHRVIPGQ